MENVSEKSTLIQKEDVVIENQPDEVLTGCGASVCCDPHTRLHRYIILVFICFLSFGNYFCFDNPAALEDVMLADLKITEAEFMSFYSWYSWPNVILCFFGGFLIDKFLGVRLGAIVFAGFVLLGQLVFATGAYVNAYWLMCAGRFIFGLGGESLAVAQNTYTVKWFKGKELHMVFGFQITFSRVGSTVNLNTMSPIYKMVTEVFEMFGFRALGITLFIGSVFCILSLMCAFVLAYFDKRSDRILHRPQILSGETINIRDVKDFPISVWLSSLICVAFYVAVFPFVAISKVFYEMKYDFTPEAANFANSIVYIISAVASPLAGLLVDLIGKNVFWLIGGSIIGIGSHALLAFTYANPYYGLSLLGLSLAVVAGALWPLLAYVVSENMLGTVYGVMQAIQNLGLGCISLGSGAIADSSGFFIVEVFFLIWLCVSLISSVVLYLYDVSTDGILNMTSKKRNKVLQKQMDVENQSEIQPILTDKED